MKPEEFSRAVVSAYNDGRGIFADKVNAEDTIPREADDLLKARYLFYVIQLDYAVRSQNLYRGARMLFDAKPSFFDPRYIIDLSNEELEELLKESLKPRYVNEAVKRYRINSQSLVEKYEGDPRMIFESSLSAKGALSSVRAFRGFGPKIGNFFVRTMINVFGYCYSDIADILPPVDVHDVRIAYLLGFINSTRMSEKTINETKELWSSACKKAGVSWLIFDKALWLLGSEGKPKTEEDIFRLIR